MGLSRAKTELFISGEWIDVTGYVLERDPISITHGRGSEASSADPSKCSLTLNNRDGRFSPRNPLSPYYGVLGRNAPIRVSFDDPDGTAFLVKGFNDRAQIDDKASLDITGDIDIRVEIDAYDWWVGGDFISKWHYNAEEFEVSNGAAWDFTTTSDGEPWLLWRDGANELGFSGERIPIPFGRIALRATLDVDNGAGGFTQRYYTAPSIDGPWTQLGTDLVGSAPTSINSTTGDLRIGTNFQGDNCIQGRYYAAKVFNGIDGTPVVDIDFASVSPGSTSFVDNAGNTVNVLEGEVTDRDYRFTGEVSEWPQSWDVTGHDRTVKLSAYGIRRRLSLNPPTLRSPMAREFSNPARQNIMAYWPLEDSAGATALAGLGGRTDPGTIEGSPQLGGYSNFTASNALPIMQTGRFILPVRPYEPTGEIATRCFLFVPNPGPSSTTSLIHLVTSTGMTWQVNLKSDGECEIQAFNAEGINLFTHTTNNFSLETRGFTNLVFELTQTGSNIHYRLLSEDFANTQTIYDAIGRVWWEGDTTGNLGAATLVTIGRQQGLGPTIIGHFTVANDIEAYTNTSASYLAWNGESPSNRVVRLCQEEDIACRRTPGNDEITAPLMGDQRDRTLIDLLSEVETSDGGLLFEPKDELGFFWRRRATLTGREAVITLNYSTGQIAGELNPVDDDSQLVNESSVRRIDGSSVTLEATEGNLTPDQVGRYTESIDVSLVDDAELSNIAAWRLSLGTVDEARYPYLTVNLHSPQVSEQLRSAIRKVMIGDRIDITGLADLGIPPEDTRQMVLGYQENITLVTHSITFNLRPYSPWMAVRLDEESDNEMSRVASVDSTLAVAVGSAETSLSIASVDTLWTTDASDMPFDVLIAGERMTVTNVTGSSSPQTFTVTRGVNGISKSLPTGSAVQVVLVPTVPY